MLCTWLANVVGPGSRDKTGMLQRRSVSGLLRLEPLPCAHSADGNTESGKTEMSDLKAEAGPWVYNRFLILYLSRPLDLQYIILLNYSIRSGGGKGGISNICGMQNALNTSSCLMLKPLWGVCVSLSAKEKILKYKRLIAKGHPKRELKPKWFDPSDQTHNHHAVFSGRHT